MADNDQQDAADQNELDKTAIATLSLKRTLSGVPARLQARSAKVGAKYNRAEALHQNSDGDIATKRAEADRLKTEAAGKGWLAKRRADNSARNLATAEKNAPLNKALANELYPKAAAAEEAAHTTSKGVFGKLGGRLATKSLGWVVAGATLADIYLGLRDNGWKGGLVAAGDAAVVLSATILGAAVGTALGAAGGTLVGPAGTIGGGYVGGFLGGGATALAASSVLPYVHKIEKRVGSWFGIDMSLDHPNKSSMDLVGEYLSPFVPSWVASHLPGSPSAGGSNPSGTETPKAGGDSSQNAGAGEQEGGLNSREVMSRMHDIEGASGVKALVMLGSSEKGDYKRLTGAATPYMAVVKLVHDNQTGKDSWVELGRVQDNPADPSYRTRWAQYFAAQSTGAGQNNNAAGQANQPAASAVPVGAPPSGGQAIPAPVTQPKYPDGNAVYHHWQQLGANPNAVNSVPADNLVAIDGVSGVKAAYHEGSFFKPPTVDFYVPDAGNASYMVKVATLSNQGPNGDAAHLIQQMQGHTADEAAALVSKSGGIPYTPVNRPTDLRNFQSQTTAPQEISGTHGRYASSDMGDGNIALYQRSKDGQWEQYNHVPVANLDGVVDSLQRTSAQSQGDGGNAASLRRQQAKADTSAKTNKSAPAAGPIAATNASLASFS